MAPKIPTVRPSMASRFSSTALAAVLAGGLALSGAVAVPAGAATAPVAEAAPVAAAKKAKKATMTVSKKSVTTTQSPFPLTVTTRMPVLKGSTAKNRALVTKHAKSLIAAERAMVAKMHETCATTDAAWVNVNRVSAAVYKGRYASVTMLFGTFGGCLANEVPTARSFTLDLKTGKKVKLSKFVAPSATVTRAAMLTALREQNPKCVNEDLVASRKASSGIPAPSGWNVSSKGVRVWFARYGVANGTCGVVSALVPWRDVATSKQIKGKRTSLVYVRGLKKLAGGFYSGDFTVLTVQGRQVSRIDGWLFSEGYCSYGVRSGKKVRGFTPGGDYRYNYKLSGTKKRPTLKLDKSWRRATSKEIAAFKKGDFPVDAIKFCGA